MHIHTRTHPYAAPERRRTDQTIDQGLVRTCVVVCGSLERRSPPAQSQPGTHQSKLQVFRLVFSPLHSNGRPLTVIASADRCSGLSQSADLRRICDPAHRSAPPNAGLVLRNRLIEKRDARRLAKPVSARTGHGDKSHPPCLLLTYEWRRGGVVVVLAIRRRRGDMGLLTCMRQA